MSSGLDVVTGGAGFIGSHLVDFLVKSGRKIRVIDNLAVGKLSNIESHKGGEQVSFHRADVADKPAMMDLISGAERVFHLAAMADIVPSIQNSEQYFRANVDGTFAVLEAARAAGVKKLVYTASSSCYGIPDTYPTPESQAIDTRYPYALTKYLGEQLAMHWAKVYHMPICSVRLFNVYGPRARTSGTYGAVFGVFLAQILSGKPLTVVGDGKQTRDFTFVADVVRAFAMVADGGRDGQIYNVGTGNPVSVNRLVELLKPKEVVYIPKRPGEPDCTMADNTRIVSDLGWRPEVSFEDGVQIMLDNIDAWRDAPVWTADKIADATADWFKYLGADASAT